MTKDIYIIKNTVNDKVYIGQSINCADRWCKHLWDARNRQITLIAKAIHELGEHNFYYQVLEANVENFDERERYWIRHFNSMAPNGYNAAPGGHDVSGIESSSSFFRSQQEVQYVIDDLQSTTMSYRAIAEKHGCGEWTVFAINNGEAYYNADLNYPIRQNNRYTEAKLKQLRYALKYEHNKSLKDLAREYHMDVGEISHINQGHTHVVPGETYPLRSGKVKNPLCAVSDKIVELLKTDMPQQDIARMFNVSVSGVSSINTGKSYRKQGETYPIRANYQGASKRNCFSPDEVRQLEVELMTTSVSMRKLAEKYECTITEIMNVNNGSVKKYHNDKLSYPLRQSFCNDYPRIAE